MVRELEGFDAFMINVFAHQREEHIEARTVDLRVLHPPSCEQCFLKIPVPTADDEHFRGVRQFLLLLPLFEVPHVWHRTSSREGD